MIDIPGGLLVGIVTAVVSALLSALLTMIFMHIRGTRKKVDEQDEVLNNLKQTLPLDYVLRNDFVRWTIKIDKKLDDLGKRMEGRTPC